MPQSYDLLWANTWWQREGKTSFWQEGTSGRTRLWNKAVPALCDIIFTAFPLNLFDILTKMVGQRQKARSWAAVWSCKISWFSLSLLGCCMFNLFVCYCCCFCQHWNTLHYLMYTDGFSSLYVILRPVMLPKHLYQWDLLVIVFSSNRCSPCLWPSFPN